MGGELLGTGVYAIRCIANGKRYVGSAARSFRYRWMKHQTQLRAGTHHSKPLQSAWDKYGEAGFVFEIFVECEPVECVTREQQFIDDYKTTNRSHGYNVCPLAGSSRGYKHTEETRKKLSENGRGRVRSVETRAKMSAVQVGRKRPPFSDEWKANLGNATRGIKRSQETRAKMSASMKRYVKTAEHCAAISASKIGRTTKPLTAEHRAKLSAAKTGKPRPPHVIAAMQRGKQAAKDRCQHSSTIATTKQGN